MNGVIRASLKNPYAVTVMAMTVLVIGCLSVARIPIDILPVFKAPAVQVLTFYGGMPAQGIEKDITNRMERWTGQANGMARQEFYRPVERGFEREIRKRLDYWSKLRAERPKT